MSDILEKVVKRGEYNLEEVLVRAIMRPITDVKLKVDTLALKIDNIATKASEVPLQGIQGDKGEKGIDGKSGKDGRDGRDGLNGKDGINGKDGVDGENGVSVVDADVGFDNRLTLSLSNGEIIDAGAITPLKEESFSVYSKSLARLSLVNLTFIETVGDLPLPVNGVIQLLDNHTYYFTTSIDLQGARLVCGQNTCLLGSSSENARLKSTGLLGEPLITSFYSLPIRALTIEADLALFLNGDATTTALDWFGVNFTNCNSVGTIKNYTNFIMTDCAFLNSAGMILDGTIGTIGFNSCLFSGVVGETTISIPSTATVIRRFRIIYSAIITPSTGVGLNISSSASIPVEGYILDTVNHSGAGVATSGISYIDNKAFFINCRGISNSAEISNYYMNTNTTITDVISVDSPVKVAGNTLSNSITQKFSNSTNRATYTGALSRSFKVHFVASILAGSPGLEIGFYIYKNGSPILESYMLATTNAASKAENVSNQCILNMETNDFIEVWLVNTSNNTDVTVTSLNLIVESVN